MYYHELLFISKIRSLPFEFHPFNYSRSFGSTFHCESPHTPSLYPNFLSCKYSFISLTLLTWSRRAIIFRILRILACLNLHSILLSHTKPGIIWIHSMLCVCVIIFQQQSSLFSNFMYSISMPIRILIVKFAYWELQMLPSYDKNRTWSSRMLLIIAHCDSFAYSTRTSIHSHTRSYFCTSVMDVSFRLKYTKYIHKYKEKRQLPKATTREPISHLNSRIAKLRA